MRVALSQIAQTIDYGVTASACNEPAGPRFLRITDIQDGSVNWDNVPWCECSEKELKSSKVRPGDIVFARTGATTGKSYLIKDCPENTVFASYLIRVRLGEKADPCYVGHFFQTNDYWSQITKGARGAAQPGVNASTLKTLQVPLPPLAEQKRIAAILDAADALRAKRRESLAQLDTLLQSTFLDMFGDPVTNPKGWEVVNLGERTTKVGSGATPRGGDESYKSEGIALIRSLNVRDGEFKWKDLARIDDTQASKLSNVAVEKNDVLLNITGASVARVCLAPSDVLPARVNQHVCIIRTSGSLDPHFLEKVLLASSMKQNLLRIGESGATRQAITKSQVLNLEIPFPPLDLQRRFANIVESVEQQKARLREHMAELDTLFASLQQRAFNGDL